MLTFLLTSTLFVTASVGQVVPGGSQQEQIDYVVGPRDILTITVFGEAELSRRYTVATDGTIDFPLLDRVSTSGLTLREIEEKLTTLLGDGYLRRPQVTVEVEPGGFRSQVIFIIGEVRSPGRYELQGGMTLLKALAEAGGPTASASNEVHVIRPPSGTSGPVLPEQGEDLDVTRVNISDLQVGLLQTVRIQDGDTIYVPEAESFFVTGHVRSPGSYVRHDRLTVRQALSLAGGVSERGSTRGIKIIRRVDGEEQEIGVNLGDLVLPGDTIIVRQRFF